MADAQLVESQRPQGRLGPLHPTEDGEGHGRAVRDARCEAGGRRLVPGAQAEPARGRAHLVLGEAGVDEREGGAPFGRGALAGPVVAQVVDVGAEHHRRSFRRRQRCHHVSQ